jgi:hypothetical protein
VLRRCHGAFSSRPQRHRRSGSPLADSTTKQRDARSTNVSAASRRQASCTRSQSDRPTGLKARCYRVQAISHLHPQKRRIKSVHPQVLRLALARRFPRCYRRLCTNDHQGTQRSMAEPRRACVSRRIALRRSFASSRKTCVECRFRRPFRCCGSAHAQRSSPSIVAIGTIDLRQRHDPCAVVIRCANLRI